MFRPAASAAPDSIRPTPWSAPDGSIELADGVSRAFLLHHRVCPVDITDGMLRVAVTDGSLREALDDLSFAYGCPVTPVDESPEELDLRIARLTRAESDFEITPVEEAGEGLTADVADLANQPPVIRYVNLLVREAQEAGASDIHLEQYRTHMEARVRVDGRLISTHPPPPGLGAAVVSRIKLLAELDIAERRRPQDGRIRVRTTDGELDLRTSTVPSLYGESVVLRLLDRGHGPSRLSDVGMSSGVERSFVAAGARPHGMMLVTGPTGSGKTTTLYAALRLRDREGEKILTVEDPVEYELEGVTQVPVHHQTGVTFASALRSLLRQDPDVLLIGEMRDRETAEIAIQAALTGHFVFSTLHTNDALGAIPRLLDLGVPAYLIAATLDGVLAQRLVRRNCSDCAEPYEPDRAALEALTRQGGLRSGESPRIKRWRGSFRRGTGCEQCLGTGFRGRTGIFEWLPLAADVRSAVATGGQEAVLEARAAEAGFRRMGFDGLAKAMEGTTTVEEVLRVTCA